MNAMYDRLQKIFPGLVGLEHSRSLPAYYRRFLDEDYSPENAEKAARWEKTWPGWAFIPCASSVLATVDTFLYNDILTS